MKTEEYKEWCEAHGEWPSEQEVLAWLPAENKMLRADNAKLRAALESLNAHDGGKRMKFTLATWIRLRARA